MSETRTVRGTVTLIQPLANPNPIEIEVAIKVLADTPLDRITRQLAAKAERHVRYEQPTTVWPYDYVDPEGPIEILKVAIEIDEEDLL